MGLTKNIVFIAKSLDGYISDRSGNLDWLEMIPNPDRIDMGYNDLINRVDAIVMGRNTFETVSGFDIDWPYTIPVFVLSNSLIKFSGKFADKAYLISGPIEKALKHINSKGYNRLYIDGGKTIQGFLAKDLIDEMIITTIPVILGGGSPLFGELTERQLFRHVKTTVFLDEIVQSHYARLQ